MNAPLKISSQAEDILEALATALQVSRSRYEAAERSYRSVGDWLHRDGSSLKFASPQVYIQGSFRLGTAIRPLTPNEDYDLDLVCELSVLKAQMTQAQLKALLGAELKAYAESKNMAAPTEGRRCWTQPYHDEAQFHLDTLPAVPDGGRQRALMETAGLSTAWTETAIAITDKDHPAYRNLSTDWPHSNPKGYANWFRSRMAPAFLARRRYLALEARAAVEDIPEFEVRTPLQSAIQILKHHRDVMFAGRCDDKPISIVITTLAALAYEQEPTIGGTLESVLRTMESFIEDRNGVKWIANPTDGAENFADRWVKHPERRDAFYEWLNQAQADFLSAAIAQNREAVQAALDPRLRSVLTESVFAAPRRSELGRALTTAAFAARMVLNPAHRRSPPWTALDQGQVRIESATVSRSGYRPELYCSGGGSLPKHCGLRFDADTNVPKPYRVYWQVVNTGREAEAANALRGDFSEGLVSAGKLTHNESTLYAGAHSIECFIVKDRYLVARSGQFIVNIG